MVEPATYRAETIGSLLRPTAVKQAMQAAATSAITPTELEQIQDQAIREVVERQLACGLDTITDGEFRRRIFWDPIIASLDGLTNDVASPVMFGSASAGDEVRLPVVTGPLGLRDSLLQRELRFVQAHHFTPAAAKATLPAMA